MRTLQDWKKEIDRLFETSEYRDERKLDVFILAFSRWCTLSTSEKIELLSHQPLSKVGVNWTICTAIIHHGNSDELFQLLESLVKSCVSVEELFQLFKLFPFLEKLQRLPGANSNAATSLLSSIRSKIDSKKIQEYIILLQTLPASIVNDDLQLNTFYTYCKERHDLDDVAFYYLANSGLLPASCRKDLANYKEKILGYILNLPDNDQNKKTALGRCLDKETALGKVFYTARYSSEPTYKNKTGTLRKVFVALFGYEPDNVTESKFEELMAPIHVANGTVSSSASSSNTSSESPNSNIQAQNTESNVFENFFTKIRSVGSSSSHPNISLANSVSVNAAAANKLSHYSDNNQPPVSVNGETLHEQYSDLMQEYLLNFIGHPDNANSKKFVSLGLTPKKEWCDSCRPEPENDDGDLPEVEDVMDIPVRLHTNEKNRFNLATLINLPLQADGKRLHPHTRRPFKLIEILPAEDIQKEINAAIKMAELNQTNKLTAPTPSAPPMEPINNPIPSAPPINELELINADSVEIQPPSEPYPVIIDPTPQLRKHDAINDDGDIAEEINDDKLPSHHLTIDNNSTLPANYSSTSNMIVALDLDIATANNSSTSSNSQQQKQEPADDILAKAPAAPNDKLENKHVDVNEIIAAAAASENKAAGTDKRKTPTMAC